MEIPFFDRKFFESNAIASRIGSGGLGGKATGLVSIAAVLAEKLPPGRVEGVEISIPRMVVVATDVYDNFIKANNLGPVIRALLPDTRLAHAFQKADLPATLLGDLRALADQVHTPLAVRSSSSLEDTLQQPFAGVYATKMIPNHQPDPDERFRRLAQAIKLVWASTHFAAARSYRHCVGQAAADEKMAVIIQEVVGQRLGERFYPTVSGVARSYNYYPTGHGAAEDGVVDLALGLGKTIVDGGAAYSYCPKYPKAPPPFNDIRHMLKNTQTRFFAINMGELAACDPLREAEYLVQPDLVQAEYDNTLRFIASTYDGGSDRILPGIGTDGPRLIDFAPLRLWNEVPLNEVVRELCSVCSAHLQADVEIEFACVLDRHNGTPARLGFLQVRPMAAATEGAIVEERELQSKEVVVRARRTLGNGEQHLEDLLYVDPEAFNPKFSVLVALELEKLNATLLQEGRPYALLGFGRWGTSDPWRGIPVDFSQISGAKVIVEASFPGMETDLSQGSHFFHNLTCLAVSYFSLSVEDNAAVDWAWLKAQPEVARTRFVRHVRPKGGFTVRVDGRKRIGVLLRHG